MPNPNTPPGLVLGGKVNDRQFGVFQLANNRTIVRPVGEDVDGYRIVEIERGRAHLRNGEREYELKVPWYDRIAGGRQE